MNKIVKNALRKVLGQLSDKRCMDFGLSKLEIDELRRLYEKLQQEEEEDSKLDYVK